ncbi:PilZ domain-containing protein [Geodermatophilus sp. YIM 151500]|uniref:flagellar brake protein n=1 Tax=Geodermatophilus sp. YIM 151500 TaxID=2984531 RepID=UPI0021E457EB|nr:PilZ domain-containing protein [Geodermatophilus sp. YIM 151500]MCV2491199.1 PilZ domain-containing protein [Geodermatophilus sp. YIM 151500]
MTSVPGIDHPEEQSEAHVSLTGRGVSVSARVEMVQNDTVVLRPSAGDFVEQAVVSVGSVVELFWKGQDDFRTAPAEVTAVEQGAVLRWRLRMTGPAEVSQRRTAVRGRVVLPLEAGLGSLELTGETADLSENGARLLLEGFGMLPEAGSTMDLRIDLESGPLQVKAEVVRVQARGARWSMSVRFPDIAEKDQDRVRRRVFQALREERARLSD